MGAGCRLAIPSLGCVRGDGHRALIQFALRAQSSCPGRLPALVASIRVFECAASWGHSLRGRGVRPGLRGRCLGADDSDQESPRSRLGSALLTFRTFWSTWGERRFPAPSRGSSSAGLALGSVGAPSWGEDDKCPEGLPATRHLG